MRSYILKLAVLVILVAPLSAWAQSDLPPPPDIIPDTTYGDVPYDIGMLALDGSEATLAEFRGRVLFINFWATWCRPCLEELPSIEALGRRVGSDSIAVLMISVDDELDAVRKFVRERGLEGRIFLRSWAAGESPFRRAVVPTTYVVTKSGMITYRHSGSANWDSDAFAAYLRDLAED